MSFSKFTFVLFLFLGIILFSCEKPEGTGGRSSINGKLYAINCYDTTIDYSNDAALSGQRVYIIYGEDNVYSDNMQTGDDGTFEFDYLRPGNYTIFAYSTDSNGAEYAVKKDVVIGKNEDKTIDPIVVSKLPDDGGGGKIVGRVKARDYNTTFTQLLSEYYFADEYVYLVYGNNHGYATRIKTDYNGYYRFDNLRKGPYSVYVYSKDSTLSIPGGIIPVIEDVYLTNNSESKEIPLITVLQ